MFLSVKSLVLIMTVTSALVDFSRSAPVKNRFLTTKELEEVIVRYLDEYYEKHIGLAQPTDRSFRGRNDSSRKKVDIYDVMQGDQPVEEGNNVENRHQPSNSTGNLTDINALQASRNRWHLAATPKPIPNILLDNAEASEQFLRILGRNTTSPPAGTLLLLPTLEVCTLGSPVGGPKGSKLRTKECNLRQLQDQAQKVLSRF